MGLTDQARPGGGGEAERRGKEKGRVTEIDTNEVRADRQIDRASPLRLPLLAGFNFLGF